jgi:ankyrin repeat protein
MNYKKVQTIVKHQFEWEKSFFFLIIITTLVMKVVFVIFNPHILLQVLGLALTIVPAFMFARIEFNGKEPGFSAKYLLSFPLSRKELFISQMIVTLFSFLPLIIWFTTFYSYSFEFMGFFDSFSTGVFVMFSTVICMGTCVQMQLYGYSRGSLAKIGFREHGFYFFYIYAALIIFGVVGVSLTYFLHHQFGLNIDQYLSVFLKSFPDIINSKWLGVIFLAMAFAFYKHTKRLSYQDKSSFRKPLNIKKELKFLGAYGSFSAVCLCLAINVVPQVRRGDLQVAVYKKDYKEIQKLISSGVDINKPNKFGMTAMMVALDKGDLDLVKFLESKGANYNGEIKKIDDKVNGFDARLFAVTNDNVKLLEYIKDKVPSFNESNSMKTMYPIHVASRFCKNKAVDYLISQGVNIEARNDRGNTPVVIATRNNCFESVITLKEAGARFDVKDIQGKVALNDVGTKASPELKMFVEKNMRMPASK